jgi:hypothetical protein
MYTSKQSGGKTMSFLKLEKSFQEHVAMESCWNIPTPIRMGVVGFINELLDASLTDSDKIAALYKKLQETIEFQPNSELETRQLVSLKSFIKKHAWFDEESKKAILEDLFKITAVEAIPA